MTTGFFKIILSTEPRLRLPNKFVNKHKENVPSEVSIQGPRGPAFQVELTISDGDTWLDKGFEPFLDYYSIKPGYLLVFKCDFERSFFHVTIFDQSSTEIDYPSTSFNGKHPEKVSNKSCCLKKETKANGGEMSRKQNICRGKKLEEVEDDVSIEILEKDKYYEDSGNVNNDISRKREMERLEKIKTWKKRKQTLKLSAHERAKAFISTRPSFVSFMHRSYIKGNLNIRKGFALEIIKVTSTCDVVLRVPGGTRTWKEKCNVASSDVKLLWRTFVKDNGLREGDACVFELLNDIMPSLNVIIFRSSEDEEAKGNPTTLTAHDKAKAVISTRPSFVSFMHRSYIDYSLSINKRFAMEFIKVKSVCDVVLRVPGGTRTWKSRCSLGSSNAKLWWSRFVKDNGLCEGDACVFELENDITPSFNVIIFRSSEDEEVKGILRNTDLDEISRKRKISKGKKLKEVDVSIEIVDKDNDNEVSAHFMNDISANKSARKVRKKERSGDESVEEKDAKKNFGGKATKRDNKEEKDEGSEVDSEEEKKEKPQKSPPSKISPVKISYSKAREDKDKVTNASAKKRSLVKGMENPKGEKSLPDDDELRDAICDILKEVDINTATCADVLKQLAKRFDTDLAPRKCCIKLMIHDELFKLPDETEDDDGEG